VQGVGSSNLLAPTNTYERQGGVLWTHPWTRSENHARVPSRSLQREGPGWQQTPQHLSAAGRRRFSLDQRRRARAHHAGTSLDASRSSSRALRGRFGRTPVASAHALRGSPIMRRGSSSTATTNELGAAALVSCLRSEAADRGREDDGAEVRVRGVLATCAPWAASDPRPRSRSLAARHRGRRRRRRGSS
jgi:hypothetical protein